MLVIFRYFLDLVLFKITPADLPPSRFLLGFSLFFYALVSILMSLSDFVWYTAIWAGLLDTLVVALLTAVLLQLMGFFNRLTQTLTAIAGSGAMISTFALIPVFWLVYAEQHDLAMDIPVTLLLILFFWSLWVISHILRYALSTQPYIGTLLAIVFYVLEVMIRNFFFPVIS